MAIKSRIISKYLYHIIQPTALTVAGENMSIEAEGPLVPRMSAEPASMEW